MMQQRDSQTGIAWYTTSSLYASRTDAFLNSIKTHLLNEQWISQIAFDLIIDVWQTMRLYSQTT